MKNIVLLASTLFLSLGFIGCEKGGGSGGDGNRNISNQLEVPLQIQQNGETVLELAPGECVSIATQDQLLALSVQENDTRGFGFFPDNWVCANSKSQPSMPSSLSRCSVTEASVVVLEDDNPVLLDKAPEAEEGTDAVEADFSECKALETEAEAEATEEEAK